MVFEILGVNLLEVIKRYNYKGVFNIILYLGAYESCQKNSKIVSSWFGLFA